MQQHNIMTLMEYIEILAKSKEDAAKLAKQKEVDANKLREERQEKRPEFLRQVHRAAQIFRSSIKGALDFVLKVLIGGMKLLNSLAFVAAELTFQTHYEVALKAIMLFITVSYYRTTPISI